MSVRCKALLKLVLIGPLACGETPPGQEAASNEGSSGDSGAAETESDTDSTPGETDVGTDDGDRLDVPVTDDELGCKKIDFLFVIDNSTSMADEQQRLIDGFPGFIRGVQDTIDEFDYHLMVVTTDVDGLSYDPCDNQLGAGRVRDAGGDDCGLLEDYLHGDRYLDAADGELVDGFSCLADVGTNGGGDEKTVWALANAITTLNDAEQCNEGFVRDDALLVVTLITDEEDNPDDGPPQADNDPNSPGNPASWREGLVEAKLGDPDAVVVLALVGDSDLPDAACEPYVHPDGEGAEGGKRLRKLAESFNYGSWSPVCQDDYADFFNDAIENIDSACAEFTPPG